MSLTDWALDPTIAHLNHGSFGGCPRSVLDAAGALRARLEAAPMTFFVRDWQPLLDGARARTAELLRAPVERTVFVTSSTVGVAIALASAAAAAALRPGDELLTTDHAYRACRNQLDRIAAASGARVVAVTVAMPFDPDALVEAFARAIGPRTRLALLDHITSPTALVLPVERLLAPLAARGIPAIVDGAHAPGQIDLDVGALLAAGATYYVGNHHKWLCAPKSSGFLAVAPGAPAQPLVTSHGASADYGPANRLHAELDWAGTYDPSAHLATPAAIADVAALGGGWPRILVRNHALALAMRDRLIDALAPTGVSHASARLAPDGALGTMVAVPVALPAGMDPAALGAQLIEERVEVPVIVFGGRTLVRLSAHLYNEVTDVDALVSVLRARGVGISSAA